MARVAFTDYSGLEALSKSVTRTRSHFFVETSAVLDPHDCEIPIRGVVLNGELIEYSIRLKQENGGWSAEVEVTANNVKSHASTAEFYFAQALDILSLKTASPSQILPREDFKRGIVHSRFHNPTISAVVTPESFDQAAKFGCLLYTYELDLLRSISWYRRGLSSPDIFFSFLGLWNSVEIASSMFCEKNDKTKMGTKNQIFQLLSDLLPKSGAQFFRPSTDDLINWITSSYDMRVQIAHGTGSTELSTFSRCEKMIPLLSAISTALLRVLTDVRCKENAMVVAVCKQAEENRSAYEAEADLVRKLF